MNKYPLISVVVLNYNGLKYLKRTIPPILGLKYPNYEVIVVDNGSTDGSLEYVRKIERIKLVKSPRLREKNFACNYAIERAKGEYILLLDNDAIITEENILKNLIDRYNKNKRTGVIGLSFYDEGFKISKSYGYFLGYYFITEKKPILVEELKKYDNSLTGFPEGKGLFIKKYIWQKVGGYDSHLKFGGEDNDLGIKLWLMGYRNYIYSRTIQLHIGMPERQDNTKYALKWKEMFYANLYTIVKNYGFFNMVITLFLYSCFGFIKSVKQALFRCDICPLLSFFSGYYLFIKNLPVAIKKRKEIQAGRVVKEDIFLKIKPTKC